MITRFTALLIFVLALTACAAPILTSSPTAIATDQVGTSAPTSTATPQVTPITPTIPPPQPSATPTLVPVPATARPGSATSVPPALTITVPAAHTPAVIHLFHVSPFQDVKPGDSLKVVWEAEGDNARICQIGAQGPTDCVDVPMRGERQFTALNTDKPYWLVLYVNLKTFPDAETIATANVYVGCKDRWFFDQPEAALCPKTSARTMQIAAQQFEHGWMLYLADEGMYLGLVDQTMAPGSRERVLLRAFDPLNITRDTASSVTAPAGLLAPASGFGLVWRGDAETYADWRGALGWALAPEFSYTGTYQCDDAVSRWQFCYVVNPDHTLVVLHPNFNWYPKSVSLLP